jgi:dihydroorotase-like cyclic amidohydrolase
MYSHSVDKARLPLTGLVRMMSTNPARIFGMDHRKGDIRAGMDADIVIYDPDPRSFIRAEELHNVAGYSPYEGWRLRGAVRSVMSRGQMVIENRQFVGEAGHGQFIPAHV